MISLFIVNIFIALKKTTTHQKKMYQIPYYKYDFFTKNNRLKWRVKPVITCTENSINCFNFEANTEIININHYPWCKLWKFF